MVINWKDVLLGKEIIMTHKRKFAFLVFSLFLLSTSGIYGGITGYYLASGSLPWDQTVVVLPPKITSDVPQTQVQNFLDTNPNLIPEGDWNCVESAILLERAATWQGIPAIAIGLDFGNRTGHMILGFPTSDNGWVFVEPQNNQVIHPTVGSIYMNNKIVSMQRLEVTWVPLEEVK